MKNFISVLLVLVIICSVISSCTAKKDDPKNTTGKTDITTTDTSTTKKTDSTTGKQETTSTTETTKPEPKPEPSDNLFSGKTDIDTLLDKIIARATEIEKDNEYGIGSIECYHLAIDEDSCETILGLSVDEFKQYIDVAMESKPEGSWNTHSVVVVKFKAGVDVKAVAEKIVAKTEAVRFGCLRPQAIVGGQVGEYLVFTTSDTEICNDVYKAVEELAGSGVTRIDREKDWSDSGLGGFGD